MSFLSLHGVGLRYGAVAALADIDLVVERGTRLAVVGASGSGKSTLLRILAGFEAPDAGQVRLDGELIVDGPAILPPHRRGVGLVAQEGALFPHLSVAENIGFGVPRRQPGRAALVAELADLVGLDAAMLRRPPDALSGGQQQRVALARALACRPRLMLLDEPFSALDTGLRAETRRAVAGLLARTGITTVLVTHDQEEAMSFADQVAVLHAGRLLQAGPPRALYAAPCSEHVAQFLGPALIFDAMLEGGWATCALGRIQVADQRSGPARIMLRPEQVTLTEVAAGAAKGAVVCEGAVVCQAEFAGGSCTLLLRLPDGEMLTLRAPQNTAAAAGESVQIAISGPAHVLPR